VTAGGSSNIGIPAHLAKGLNITQDMHVEIYVEVEAEISSMVHVEPESPDDWEILELNASFVEMNLLVSQISYYALPPPRLVSLLSCYLLRCLLRCLFLTFPLRYPRSRSTS
jgi:antitoxin component of MazEF toxin-antitoxin module